MYLILPSVEQGGIKYYFKVFGMTQPGILPTWPMSGFYLKLIILYNFNHLFADSEIVTIMLLILNIHSFAHGQMVPSIAM